MKDEKKTGKKVEETKANTKVDNQETETKKAATEETQEVETKPSWLKRHWKGIVAGTLAAGGAIIGVILVKKYGEETEQLTLKQDDIKLELPEIENSSPEETATMVKDTAEDLTARRQDYLESVKDALEKQNEAIGKFNEEGGEEIVSQIREKLDDIRQIAVDNDISINVCTGLGPDTANLDEAYCETEVYKDGVCVHYEE